MQLELEFCLKKFNATIYVKVRKMVNKQKDFLEKKSSVKLFK